MQAKPMLILLLLTLAQTTFSQTADWLLGNWKDLNDDSKVIQFFLSDDGMYYGKASGNSGDHKLAVGQILFHKCWFDSAKKTFKGTMQPPNADVILHATITFEDKNKIKVVVQKFLLSRTFYFIKTG